MKSLEIDIAKEIVEKRNVTSPRVKHVDYQKYILISINH